MTKTAVVILNWNGKKFLQQFLPFVKMYTQDAQLWVIDNASTDDSVSFVRTNFPKVKVLVNKSNTGFAGGYNEGLAQIKAQYYLLLNSDIEVTPNWLTPLKKMLDENPNIVACQPKILTQTNKQSFEYAGAAGGFLDKDGIPFCRGRILNTCENDLKQYNENREIFWASGACLMIRSDAFHKVNGFDESYFAHMEEIDLCWRLKNIGHSIWYCGGSTVYHVGGGTLDYDNPKKIYLNCRNSLITLVKNHRSSNLLFKILFRLVVDGVAGLLFVLRGKIPCLLAVLKAHVHFYGRLNKTLKTRKKLGTNLNINKAGELNRSILIEYYLRGKKKFSELQL